MKPWLWRLLPNWYLRRWVADKRMRRHHCHVVDGRCVLTTHPNPASVSALGDTP